MIRYKPTLIINRLVAYISNKVIYDEKYHLGLNILSGCNGGGKTSVIQLLMHGLGYEVKKWKDEARSCTDVYIEISINGSPITLKRGSPEKEKQGIDICFSTYAESIVSNRKEWKSFPYSINKGRESFSQKIFSLMDMPEVRGDSSNITMHQIFRLLYSDQSNPAYSLFNIEQFDSALKRETIGNYLLGLYDDEIYNARLALNDAEKDLSKLSDQLQSIHSVIGKTSYSNEFSTVSKLKKEFNQRISELLKIVKTLRENPVSSGDQEKETLMEYAMLNINQKAELLENEEDMRSCSYEIADSKNFIRELTNKLSSIKDSLKVDEYISDIHFSICPSCYSSVDRIEEDVCNLCGSEQKPRKKKTNVLRMKNEIEIQLRESRVLLAKKEATLEELGGKRKEIISSLRILLNKIQATKMAFNTKHEKLVYEAYREIGELEEKLQNLDKLKELYDSIQSLTKKKMDKQHEVSKLKKLISSRMFQFERRTLEVKELVSTHLKEILHSDIGAEEAFKFADIIEFDFAANRISVNGKVSFSESSTVYLNNAFHLSLFLVALEKEYIRIPRIMILDGIENGGMEDIRSKNFQTFTANKLSEYSIENQLIIATKSIDPSLDKPNYVVGRTYTKHQKSLKI